MLDIGKSSSLPAPKCYFSSTTLPSNLDPSQLPTKKPPFNLLHSAPYYHTMTLLSPSLSPGNTSLSSSQSRYARLRLPLSHILTGDFFTKHVKTGNVLLLSSPLNLTTTSSSAKFSLVNGVLSITCDRATYERAGLPGHAIPDPHARKHGTTKFLIEVNLRLPSMLAGKKGFERLLRAAETVFVGALSWLFYDISAAGVGEGDGTLGKDVQIRDIAVETETMDKATVPEFPSQISKDADREIDVVELLEWICLAAVDSPRIKQGDLVDEIISRYRVPSSTSSTATDTTIQDLTRTTITGFMPRSFITSTFTAAICATKTPWFALLVQGFEEGNGKAGKNLVVFKTEGDRVLSWELEG